MANGQTITLQIEVRDDGSPVIQQFATTVDKTFRKVEEKSQGLVDRFRQLAGSADSFKLKLGELEGAFKTLVGMATLYKIKAGISASIGWPSSCRRAPRACCAACTSTMC